MLSNKPVKLRLFQNITQPDHNGYQVRVVRNKKLYSKYFTFSKYGTANKTLEAANIWRDQIKSRFSGNILKRKLQPSSNNKSTGVLGVCRSISWDKRKNLKYIIFQVRWRDYQDKTHNKTFRACNVDDNDASMIYKAFQAAKDFRTEWEYHCDQGTLKNFEPLNYLNWREN